MTEGLPDATVRFLAAAKPTGVEPEIRFFPDGTKTSADAAAAVGCDLAAIAKSLVFMADDRPILVIMSGDRRVDLAKTADVVGAAKVRRASLEEARTHTGYAAGGTPAIGLASDVEVYADVSLKRNDPVWSAAGTPTTVYEIPLPKLVAASGATWVDVSE